MGFTTVTHMCIYGPTFKRIRSQHCLNNEKKKNKKKVLFMNKILFMKGKQLQINNKENI